MATVINARDVALQAASPRTVSVDLGSTVNVNGTLNGTAVSTVVNAALSATANYFTTSASDPTGGSNGDAHYNTSTDTMWFKISGIWKVGGTINANQITTGTLAAARIAASSITTDKISIGGVTGSNIATNTITGTNIASNTVTGSNIASSTVTGSNIASSTVTGSNIASTTITGGNIVTGTITADKLSVLTLSAVAANLGTVTAGDISGSANIDISGRGVFGGNYTTSGYNSAVHGNPGRTAANGVTGYSSNFVGAGVRGDHNGSGYGVNGFCSSSAGYGVWAENNAGGVALQVVGKMAITSSALVSNLRSATTMLADDSTKWAGYTYYGTSTGTSTGTFVATNKPGVTTSNVWVMMSNGSTTLRWPVWLA